MKGKVVHCMRSKYEVYIGRGLSPLTSEVGIWGNPFTFKESKIARFKVKDRKESIDSFKRWVIQRQDIIDRVHELKGKTLGCWCYPQECHGEVLIEMSEYVYKDNDGIWVLPKWLILSYEDSGVSNLLEDI